MQLDWYKVAHALKRVLAHLENDLEHNNENALVYLLDFKGDDTFSAMDGCIHHFSFMNCLAGLDEFYSILTSRQNGDKDRTFALLVFDEYASFLECLDKKTENEARAKISALVMQMRSFNMACIFGTQAGYSETFNKIRNNISIVLTMGHLTRELKTMFYSSVADEVNPNKLQGYGSLLIDGCILYDIVIPKINDTAKLDSYIIRLLNRTSDSTYVESPPVA